MTSDNTLSDIEEDEESNVNSISNSYHRQPSVLTRDSSEAPDSTSKSCTLPVDPSVLALVSGLEDDLDDSDEIARDPIFGSCCDLIRVCILVDIIYIVKNICIIITVYLGLSVTRAEALDNVVYDDDDAVEQMTREMENYNYTVVAKNIAGIIVASIGIYGTVNFNKWIVLVVAVFCCLDVLVSVLLVRWIAAIVAAFFMYPQFALFFALHKETITRDNYIDDVRHCCCKKCLKEQVSGSRHNNNVTEKEMPHKSNYKTKNIPMGSSSPKISSNPAA